MIGAEIEHLIKTLSKLPGIGQRTARRMALQMLKKPDSLMRPLASSLQNAAEAVSSCQVCQNLDSQNPCALCQDDRRDPSILCIVEDVSDLWALERTGSYRGAYHVLGGTLSALDGIGPEDLHVPQILTRCKNPEIDEVIIALNATINGQTTAHYLADKIHEIAPKITTTKLAHGVPIGGELDYLDDGTLTTALHARGTL